jgi:hypothetical protein
MPFEKEMAELHRHMDHCIAMSRVRRSPMVTAILRECYGMPPYNMF